MLTITLTGLEQFRGGDEIPGHGLFGLRIDNILDNLGVTEKTPLG